MNGYSLVELVPVQEVEGTDDQVGEIDYIEVEEELDEQTLIELGLDDLELELEA